MKRQAIYDVGSKALRSPLDIHKEIKSKNINISKNRMTLAKMSESCGLSEPQGSLETDWLPFCASHYNISKDLRDFIVSPVPIINSELPNRNGVGFPLKSLLEWNIEQHTQAYKTWKGCPTHLEHDNADPLKAKGVVLDVFLKKIQNFGQGKIWKVLVLLAFDRTKDEQLCKDILSGEMNSFSMGAMVEGYTCSKCGEFNGSCGHIDLKNQYDFYRNGEELIYRQVHGISGFEVSAVEIPAFNIAISEKVNEM